MCVCVFACCGCYALCQALFELFYVLIFLSIDVQVDSVMLFKKKIVSIVYHFLLVCSVLLALKYAI